MDEPAPRAAVTAKAPSLLRHGALSAATSAAPIVVALIALPLLTRALGTDRFGLLSLAWAWLGYATLLDFGLGRTLTRMVAASDATSAGDPSLGSVIATAHVTLALFGGVVGVAGAIIAPWYVSRILHVPEALRTDAIMSAVLFALTVPAVTAASVPRAVLEARHRFRDVNLVRLPVSVGAFAVPTLLLPFTASLTAIAATIGVMRVWAWWRYHTLAATTDRAAGHARASREHLAPLLRAGAWMTISNVLSPLMTYADRFLIGSMISVTAVALYAVPWEAVTKLWIVPGALTMVLFPAIARTALGDTARLGALHAAGVRLMTLIVLPVSVIACVLAPWLLQFAGGAQYRGDSVLVLRILTIGVAANCVGAVPFTLLQAAGRARWTATLHLVEIVPYGLTLWFAARHHGIVGVAAAWTGRVVVDAALLAWRAQSVAPLPATILLLEACMVAAVALSAWAATVVPTSNHVVLIVPGVLATAAALLLWWRRPAGERLVLGRADELP